MIEKVIPVRIMNGWLPGIIWLGGAFFTANQDGNGFWDGVVWLWYVGRYIASHFAQFHY